MFLLFRKPGFSAINKAWIKLSFGGNTSFKVLFVVEYQFCVVTAFSLDTWNFIVHKHVVYHVYHH